MPRVYFTEDDVSNDIPEHAKIMKACGEEGTSVEFGCRRGVCGTCLVTILSGIDSCESPTMAEQVLLEELKAKPNQRLACQCKITGDIIVSVPGGKKPVEQGWFGGDF